jgi:putative copper resistance protein D
MEWSPEPGVIAWLLLAEGLYLHALHVLAGRGVAVPVWQRAAWHAGLALQAVGLLSPIDALGDDALWAHMAQHLLIADLAAPLLLVGLRNPVLVFFLPRPLLVALARRARLRAAFRFLRRPLVAIPVYALVLYAWHIAPLFEAAVRHPLVHVLQHASFIGIGMLIWWSVLEPKRRRPRGALWKIAHIIGARMLGMLLGMSFVLIRTPVYTGVYGRGERAGLDPVADQQLAGAMMVVLDILIMVFALAYFFWRAAEQHDRDEAATAARAGAAG